MARKVHHLVKFPWHLLLQDVQRALGGGDGAAGPPETHPVIYFLRLPCRFALPCGRLQPGSQPPRVRLGQSRGLDSINTLRAPPSCISKCMMAASRRRRPIWQSAGMQGMQHQCT
jgi:hypothetical protein